MSFAMGGGRKKFGDMPEAGVKGIVIPGPGA